MKRFALASIILSFGASAACIEEMNEEDSVAASPAAALAACPTVSQLFPHSGGATASLNGRLIQMPCGDTPPFDDCRNGGWIYNGAQTACSPSGNLTVQQDFRVAGTPGKKYLARMRFYGIMEPKNYGAGVTRAAAPNRPGDQNTGANPPPWAFANSPSSYTVPISTANTYEMHVFNNLGTQNANRVGLYFLNADTVEQHKTYVVNFERTISVIGGGTVRMRTFDSNCRQMKNCGPTGGFPCASKARTVNISGAVPQPPIGPPPGGFQQPGLGKTNDHAGQWFLTDVVQVTCP